MKWLVFDCPSGISGDMTLGAIVDLGVSLASIRQTLATLPLSGYALHESQVTRNSIAATRVEVELKKAPEQHHRHLRQILEILQAGSLSPRALEWAEAIFRRLAEAEAAVHRIEVEKVHFHEVGATDAIVDIAGTCIGLDLLCTTHDVDGFRTSQIRAGRGTVRTEHGVMPVPAPATLRLLEGFPIQFNPVDGERVTPTGAAILTTLAEPLGERSVRVLGTGYGAGAQEFADAANVLRLLLCEAEPQSSGRERATHVGVLRTTIDDMVPEFYGHLMQRLFAVGALDVYFTPIYMKKGRPATQVTVIAEPDESHRLAEMLLNESTTLGVRIAYEERMELPRRLANVETAFGVIQVKIATRPDGKLRMVPEYESVRQAAEAAGVPWTDVYSAALRVEGIGNVDGGDRAT